MRGHARGLILLGALLLVSGPAFAGDGAKDPKCAKKSGFGALFLGEGGQTYAPSCDQTDFQTEQGFQHGAGKAPAENAGPERDGGKRETSPGAAASAVRPSGPSTPSSAVRATPAWGTGAVRAWPGPRRPAQEGETPAPAVTPKEESAAWAPASPLPEGSIPAADEPMRDAMAAVDPMRYSLWAGLSAPLLMPGSKAGDIPLEQAKVNGRADYESHILGEDAKTIGPGVSGPDLAGLRLEADPSEGLFVSLELELSGTLRDAVASLTERSGFRPDEKFTPAFSDEAKTRVMLRGWVPPHRLGEVLGPGVHRMQVHRSSRPDSEGARTELLVGLSIPTGASPSAVLSAAASRLALRSGFEVRKVIGYQTIPGTSRMVIIVSGQVPVSNIAKVMGDPSVVKVVPSPDSVPAQAAAPAQRRSGSFLSHAASKNPVLFLLALLLTLSLAGTAFARSR